MHESHIQNLRSLLPNIERALRDNETVTIGGGQFGWAELNSMRLSVIGTINRQIDNGSEYDRAQPRVGCYEDQAPS